MKTLTRIFIFLLTINLCLFSNEIHNKSKSQVKSKIFSSNNQIVKNQIIKNQIIKKRIQQRLMKAQTQQRDGCEEGFVDDCSGDGDCCPESWIGDGLLDCEDPNNYGCDLTCYDNDGGDCNDDGGGDGGGDCDTIAGNEDWLGDGWCDDINNNETCGFDNGDCCYSTCVSDAYDCEADSGPCVADICIDPNGNNDDCEDGGGDSCEDLGLVTCDDGSCAESLSECSDGGEEDCEFFDCEGQEACGYEGWLGDGLCDDGTWGIYYNCDEFNNDEGDCDDDGGGDGDGCADDEFECNDGTCITGSYENDGWCDCSLCEDELGDDGCYQDGDCCDCTFPENCPDDCDDGGGDGECPEGTVDDCSGDGDCCPENWIGDGYGDCEDQPYDCDLTCYDNDGGDCSDDGAGNENSIVSLSIGDATGIEGEIPGEGIQFGVEIPLFYESSESIGGIQFTISDNPNWVTGIDLMSVGDCFESNSNDVNGSMIGILFSLEGCELDASDSSVHFATIIYEFSAEAQWGELFDLIFSDAIVSDGSGNALSVETSGSAIDVSILGDVSSDMEVNVIDVVTLINYILFIEEPGDYQHWAADVNSDTVLNILDVVMLVDLILDR